MRQLDLIETPRWTGKLVYLRLAGPLAKYNPFESLDPMHQRAEELTAQRWNDLGYPVPTSTGKS